MGMKLHGSETGNEAGDCMGMKQHGSETGNEARRLHGNETEKLGTRL